MHLLAIAANIESDGAVIAKSFSILVRFTSHVSLLTSLFANNVTGLGEGGEFNHKSRLEALMFNLSTKV